MRPEEALQFARHRLTEVRSVDLDGPLAAAGRDQVSERRIDWTVSHVSKRTPHRRPERRFTPHLDDASDELIEFSIGHDARYEPRSHATASAIGLMRSR